MTQEKPQPSSQPIPDQSITDAIGRRLVGGRFGCADAFAVARELNAEALAVGKAADALSAKLARCQLGLFGYPGKQGWQAGGVTELAVPDGLEAAIAEAGSLGGRVACAAAWSLAESYGVSRLQVGWLAEKLGIRIVSCQLGAF